MIKAFINTAGFGITLLLVAAAFFLAYIATPIFGNKAMIVRSGSMQPAIGVGDLVIVHQKNNFDSPQPISANPSSSALIGTTIYKEGSIIAFQGEKNSKVITTHRIIGKEIKDGKVFYRTKGDANDSPDGNLVAEERIIGSAQIKIAEVGKVFAFAKTRNGFLAAVVAPALLVIFFEIINIIKEVRRIRSKNAPLANTSEVGFDSSEVSTVTVIPNSPSVIPANAGIQNPSEDWILNQVENDNVASPVIPSKEGIHNRFSAPIPMGGVALRVLFPFVLTIMFFHNSFAFFSDSETSTGNTFQASDQFPSINDIVINEVYYRIALVHRIGSEADSEWAELYNPTNISISLENWSISDNTSCDNMPNALIPDHGFAIVSTHTEAEFRAVWTTIPTDGSVVFVTSPSAIGNGLANNDELALRSGVCPSGPIVDHISWGANISGLNPSIPAAGSAGISHERDPDGVDTDTNADFVDRNPPTPGI